MRACTRAARGGLVSSRYSKIFWSAARQHAREHLDIKGVVPDGNPLTAEVEAEPDVRTLDIDTPSYWTIITSARGPKGCRQHPSRSPSSIHTHIRTRSIETIWRAPSR